MADADRSATARLTLEAALEERPYAFDFFEALRRLQCAHPDRPRLGHARRPADEPVRLGQEPSAAFAPASLARFIRRGARSPRLSVLFFGLFGPSGPLPLHLTEYAHERARNHRDPTFARFADLFHHRLLALFFRAWADAEPAVSFDRPQDDHFGRQLAALVGLGLPSLRERDAIPDLAKLHNASLLVAHSRPAAALAGLLESFFRVPATIEEFVGRWISLPEDQRCRLGASRANGCLGESLTVGDRVWDCQQKFRIAFGPLTWADYQRMLPGREGLERLTALVRGAVGDELLWEVVLVLRPDEAAPLQLDGSARLGWTSWLSAPPAGREARDMVMEPVREAND
jgi:type VI secretion system protein ImpH